MARNAIGYALTQVLEGGEAANSISPTDLAKDIHDAAVNLENFLENWTQSGDQQCERAGTRLLPVIRELSKLTEDKYSLVRE